MKIIFTGRFFFVLMIWPLRSAYDNANQPMVHVGQA